ncbi:MAG: phosphonate C-P lyase system protein PhnH [Rhodobacteraceae bacterium]|nr:phosphonate C-P lyase system protein PhnH [Paracoccaceae bacterium]
MDPLLERELELAAKQQGITKSQFIVDAVERALGRKDPYKLLLEIKKEYGLDSLPPRRRRAAEKPAPDETTGDRVRKVLRAKHEASMRDWVAFHVGAPLVAAEAADFALGTWAALQPVTRFKIGQPDYPDRSATLIVEVDRLTNHGPALTGPGIALATWLSLPETAAFRANRALFPLGFDCLFTFGNRLAGLPRSTKVEKI